MKTNSEICRLWHECFPTVSREWMNMFLATSYSPDHLRCTVDADGGILSSLLLQPRRLILHGHECRAAYLSFACTTPRRRGSGLMSQLLGDTLRGAHDDGVVATMLIPAQDWLADFYHNTGGWSRVVYTRHDCYTSVHQFAGADCEYTAATDCYPDELYEAVERYTPDSGGYARIAHSARDFDAVIADCRMEGGDIVAVADSNGRIAGVASAVPDDFYRVVTVRSAVGRNSEAVAAVLEAVRQRFADYSITVISPASDDHADGTRRRSLYAGGMARITDVGACLDHVARYGAAKGWAKTVRVHDPMIPANCNTWRMEGGVGAMIDDTLSPRGVDAFDVGVDVLAAMVFGSRPIAELIDFPANRLIMSLMLE